MRQRLKHTQNNLVERTAEERIEELEKSQEFMLRIIWDMCNHLNIPLPNLPDDDVESQYHRVSQANDTITEQSEKDSSAGNSVPNMRKVHSAMAKPNDLAGRQTMLSSS